MHTVDAARDWLQRSRGRLVIALVLIVGLYFVVAFGEQAWKARELEAEVAERVEATQKLQARRDELRQQLDDYTSDQYLDYVERTARRDLNLSHPGETVLLVRWLAADDPLPEVDAERDQGAHGRANWQKWLDLFGLDRLADQID